MAESIREKNHSKEDLSEDEIPKGKKGLSNMGNTLMIGQAMLQRREWSRRYGLTSKSLFELFSEFISMITLSKDKSINKVKTDPLISVLPVDEN
jgi:hypothetical protein